VAPGRADLSGVNTIAEDLSSAHLTDAYLAGAILTNANLSGAELSNTHLTNTKLDGQTQPHEACGTPQNDLRGFIRRTRVRPAPSCLRVPPSSPKLPSQFIQCSSHV
jgi:Pentapeptide repeats (8 copies)